jgi:proline utilization trans-activator
MTDLSTWYRNFPTHLRVDFANPAAQKDVSREQVSIYLHYHQCINMAARPLLFHVVQTRLLKKSDNRSAQDGDWHEGLSNSTIAVIDACVKVARDSATILCSASKQNLVGIASSLFL